RARRIAHGRRADATFGTRTVFCSRAERFPTTIGIPFQRRGPTTDSYRSETCRIDRSERPRPTQGDVAERWPALHTGTQSKEKGKRERRKRRASENERGGAISNRQTFDGGSPWERLKGV